MSRYRLEPTPAQEAILLRHCGDARYVWNLAVEQHSHWRRGRKPAPGYLEQCRQLTAARGANRWLAEGSQMVQQQALRDFDQAMRNFSNGTHRKPTWRKASRDEGFRVVAVQPGHVRQLNRHCGRVLVRLSQGRQARLVVLQRRLARAKRGSNRRARTRLAIARLRAREADARKDWCEKTSTSLAKRFDVICVEDLSMAGMTRTARGTIGQPGRNVRAKAGLNREISRSGWGLLVRRLEDKAPGRVQKINPAYTSQRCSACGHVARESRQSQALFLCVACYFACNADVNAARNIAAGHAVIARGGDRAAGPVNREPQLGLLAS
jgi:putative transposase